MLAIDRVIQSTKMRLVCRSMTIFIKLEWTGKGCMKYNSLSPRSSTFAWNIKRRSSYKLCVCWASSEPASDTLMENKFATRWRMILDFDLSTAYAFYQLDILIKFSRTSTILWLSIQAKYLSCSCEVEYCERVKSKQVSWHGDTHVCSINFVWEGSGCVSPWG